MQLYRDINVITRQHGAAFFIVNSDPSTEHIIGPKIKDMGIDLISLPKEYRPYLPWTYIYNDGHPNFLWAWILSSAIRLDWCIWRLDAPGQSQAGGTASGTGTDTAPAWLTLDRTAP